MSRLFAVFVIVLTAYGFAGAAEAQQAGRPAAPARPMGNKLGDPGAVTNALKSNDNFQVQQAVEAAVWMLSDEKNAKKATEEAPSWLKLLLAQKRLDEVEEVALASILTQSASLPLLEKCQEFRVRAKLVAGKPQEAIPLAKGLYNVCAMPSTSHAIDLISECLYDANTDGDPAAIVKQYKVQQIRGASMPATSQPAGAGEKPMLAKVQVDGKVYQEAIAACDLNDDGFTGLMAKANLLLLADKPKEAKKALEKAYSLSSDKNLTMATEAVARAMRAEDGTVGRANAWILSLRPPEVGQ